MMSKPRSKLINYKGRRFRQAYGFTTEIHFGKQAKHMPGQPNFDPTKSPVTIPITKIQELVELYAGTGEKAPGANKEFVDFKIIIGLYAPRGSSERVPTRRGTIHYSTTGAHIVPTVPKKGK